MLVPEAAGAHSLISTFMATTGKTIAYLVTALGVALVLVFLIVFRDRIAEVWCELVGPRDTYVVLETDIGEIYIDVFEESTPLHAENFKKLVAKGFYDGLTFHRVIEQFMAQGGDPTGTGDEGPGYRIDAEIDHPHLRGSVAAARKGDKVNPQRKSDGSQFYICFSAQPHLDAGYTVFGHVVRGMDVVDKIKRGPPSNLVEEARTTIEKAVLISSCKVRVESSAPAK